MNHNIPGSVTLLWLLKYPFCSVLLSAESVYVPRCSPFTAQHLEIGRTEERKTAVSL